MKGKNGTGAFRVSVFVDQEEESIPIATYQFQRERSIEGNTSFKMTEKKQEIGEEERKKINQKIVEAVQPVLLQLKEDLLWEEK